MAPRDPKPTRATTTYGEAVEQAADGLSMWYDEVAALVQDDVDCLVNGSYRVSNFATAGIRLMQVNVRQLIQMAGVFSDNLAMISQSQAGSAPRPDREVTLMIPIPSGPGGDFVVSSLVGTTTPGRRVPTESLHLDPPAFTAGRRRRQVEVKVAVNLGGITPDIYRGFLSARVSGSEVASLPFIVAIDELV